MCEPGLPTYHIAEAGCLMSAFEIRHKPVGGKDEAVSAGWLPAGGEVVIGLTSGASTPDNLVGMVVRRLDDLANLSR
jgi:4-hydroxy-3-methylbut-2-enyl diphosphate reductase